MRSALGYGTGHTHSLVDFFGGRPFLNRVHNLTWKSCVSSFTLPFRLMQWDIATHPGSGWPGILALEIDPAINVRDGQKLGDLGVCYHFGFRTSQDTH